MPIAAFTTSGVLPPFAGDSPTDPARMGPFTVAFREIADRFGSAPRRWTLVKGLADYRTALHATGIPAGFQWIDGSFLEDAKTVRGRPPADINLVMFASLPLGVTARDFRDRHADLPAARLTKPRFGCDAYFVDLGLGARRRRYAGHAITLRVRIVLAPKGIQPLERYAPDRLVFRRRGSVESPTRPERFRCCASLNAPA